MVAKQSIKTKAIDKFNGLNLIELEQEIARLQARQDAKPTTTLARELAAARIALQKRQHKIKAQVMEFEQTNDHHLVFFASTQGFVKLAGRSALFFAMTVAERINWRCSLKPDTDHYSTSEDGIIAFRSLARVAALLEEIGITVDNTLDTPELHFYKLAKVYNDDQVAKLRDNSRQDIRRISEIVLPASPIPSLYDGIARAGQMIYFLTRHSADGLFRETIGKRMVEESCEMLEAYLNYATLKSRSEVDDLLKVAELAVKLRRMMAFGTKIQVIHHRDARKILEELVRVERIARSAYGRAEQRNRIAEAKKLVAAANS